MKKGFLGSIIAGVVVVGIPLGFLLCTTKIPSGYAGVQYRMNGGVDDEVLTQGWNVVSPTKKIEKYSVATEQAYLSKDDKEGSPDDDSFSIPTSDNKSVNVDVEFSYHYDVEKLPKTYTMFKGQNGKEIEQTFIRAKIKAWSQEVSGKFSLMDMYGSKRDSLNQEVLKHVKNKFDKYGIVIESVNFTRISLDAQTEKAIQTRINAQQELEKSKIEKQKAEVEAQKAIVEAQGRAEVTRLGAEAEANANKLKQSTLNDTIVKYEAIKKWNGALPNVTGGATPIIDMKGLTSGK